MLAWFAALGRDRRATVGLVAAFTITLAAVVIGFTVQVADLYIIRLQAQRAADLAALAAAVGSSAPVISSGAASASAVATALNVATVNGFGSPNVTTTGAAGSGGTSTLTTAITSKPAALMGSWIGGATPVVKASSQVQMTSVTISDCVAALGGSIQLSGNFVIDGPSCGVAASSDIVMSGGLIDSSATAVGVHAYDEQPLITGGTQIPATSSFLYNAATTDTLATNAAVVAAKAHLSSLSSWPYGSTIPQTVLSPSVPSGSAESVSNTTVTVPAQTHAGAATITSSTVNFTGYGSADTACKYPTTVNGTTTLNGANTLNFGSGCYVFAGAVSTDNSSSNNAFNVNSGASVTFVFEGAINQNTTGGLTFGNANSFSFGGPITVGNGGHLTFGTGTKMFAGQINHGSGVITFGSGTSYLNGVTILGETGTTNFGSGPFYMWNGSIDNTNWGTMYFASGPFYFYNSTISNGTGAGTLELDGGPYYFYNSTITLGSNSASYTRFAQGNMDFYDGGGISINGGGVVIGGFAGDYDHGDNTNGGAAISLYGGSVTISGGGYFALWGGTIALNTGSFNMEGGTLEAAAPTSSAPNYGYQDIVILSTGGAVSFSGGSSGLAGMIYAPASNVTISGGAALSQNYASACLGVAAQRLTLSGASSIVAYPCTGAMPTTTGNDSALDQ